MRTERLRLNRRAVGKAMLGTGVLGLVLSLVGTVVGYRLVSQVHESVDDSLLVTTDALSSVQSSITVTRELVQTSRDGLLAVSGTLGSVNRSVLAAQEASTSAQVFLSGPLPNSIEAVNRVLPTIRDVASSIDDALRVLSAAPFGPNYDPRVPFDDAIGELATALAPLPTELRNVTGEFDELRASTAQVTSDVATLQTSIDSLVDRMDDVDVLLDEYATATTRAQTLATDSRDDLTSSSNLAQVLVVLLGLTFALGQLVPIWLGRALMADPVRVSTVIARDHEDDDEQIRVIGSGPRDEPSDPSP